MNAAHLSLPRYSTHALWTESLQFKEQGVSTEREIRVITDANY